MIYDIVIHNGTVLTLNPDFDIIKNGIVCIRDSRIEKIQTRQKNTVLPTSKKTIDARGTIVLPGLVNTHTHLPMTLFRGLADDLPLQEWLHKYIFPVEATHINDESAYWSTMLGIVEMIRTGTTTFCDGYFYEDSAARAVSDSGIRAILAQGVIDFPAPGVPDPKMNLKVAEAFVMRWQAKSSLLRPSVFCHSPYTCSPDTLSRAKEICLEHLLF